MAMLAGVGFTVSLLIGELAFGAGQPSATSTSRSACSSARWPPRCSPPSCCGTRNRVYRRMHEIEERDDDRDGVPDVYRDDDEHRVRVRWSVGSARRPETHEDPHGNRSGQADEPTIGRLVTDAQRDIRTLISKEIELAKSELKVSVKAGGIGLGLFAAAAFMLVLAVIMLSVAFAYLIHWNGDGLDLQWAFLIVFGVYVLIAALLVFLGVRKVKKVQGARRGPSSRAARSRRRSRARPDRGQLRAGPCRSGGGEARQDVGQRLGGQAAGARRRARRPSSRRGCRCRDSRGPAARPRPADGSPGTRTATRPRRPPRRPAAA